MWESERRGVQGEGGDRCGLGLVGQCGEAPAGVSQHLHSGTTCTH